MEIVWGCKQNRNVEKVETIRYHELPEGFLKDQWSGHCPEPI